MVKEIDVNPNDAPALRKAMAAPACVDTKLSVVVLREWRSGSQEVVTVPNGSCSPVRLRLDHGRLSPTGVRWGFGARLGLGDPRARPKLVIFAPPKSGTLGVGGVRVPVGQIVLNGPGQQRCRNKGAYHA